MNPMIDVETTEPIQILFAEDNKFAMRDFQKKMSKWDRPHQIHLAKDGEAARSFLERQRAQVPPDLPDLVILDLMMPRLNGIEVLAHIRNTPEMRDLPVIAWTCSTSPFDEVRTEELRIDGYVRKQDDPEKLLATIEAILRI